MNEPQTSRASYALFLSGANLALFRSGAAAAASFLNPSSVEYFGETGNEGSVERGIVQVERGIEL